MTANASKTNRHKEKPPCPGCNGRLTRISRPLAFKIFLFWWPVKRYKCLRCGKKTYLKA